MHRLCILLMTTMLLAACSAAEASPTPTLFVPPTDDPTATQGIVLTTEAATPALATEPSVTPAEAIVVSPTIPATPFGRPEAPAPIEADFRADSATHVAATGNPQVLEFFAYW
jgi:hypothetical protein